MDEPLYFDPFLRPMVWGGRRLADVLGKPLPAAGPFGESWEVSDHASHSSRVAAGPHAGRTLADLMRRWRDPLLGPAAGRHARFPLLVKLLDVSPAAAASLLDAAGGSVKRALLMGFTGCDAAEADRRLASAGGVLRRALGSAGNG